MANKKDENKQVKSVSLNKTKENDQKILNHVKRRKFSKYVKELILQDIERKEEQKKAVTEKEERTTKPISVKEQLEQLKKREQSSAPSGVFIKVGNLKKEL